MESVFDKSNGKNERRMTLVRRSEFNAYNALLNDSEDEECIKDNQENKSTNLIKTSLPIEGDTYETNNEINTVNEKKKRHKTKRAIFETKGEQIVKERNKYPKLTTNP
jgi:hypothetical protein